MYRSPESISRYSESKGSIDGEQRTRQRARKQPVVLLRGQNRNVFQDVRRSYPPSEMSMDGSDRFTAINPRLVTAGSSHKQGLRVPRPKSVGSQGSAMDLRMAAIQQRADMGGFVDGVPGLYAAPEEYYGRVYPADQDAYYQQGFIYDQDELSERINRARQIPPSGVMMRDSGGYAIPVGSIPTRSPRSPSGLNMWEGMRPPSQTHFNGEDYYQRPLPPRPSYVPGRTQPYSDFMPPTDPALALGQYQERLERLSGIDFQEPSGYPEVHGVGAPLQSFPQQRRPRANSRESILLEENAGSIGMAIANGLDASTDSVFYRPDRGTQTNVNRTSNERDMAPMQGGSVGNRAGEMINMEQMGVPKRTRVLLNDQEIEYNPPPAPAQIEWTRKEVTRKRSKSWCEEMDTNIDSDHVASQRRHSWSPVGTNVLSLCRENVGTIETGGEDGYADRIRNWAIETEIAMMDDDIDIDDNQDNEVRSTLASSYSPYSTSSSGRRQTENTYDYTVKRSTKDPNGEVTEDIFGDIYSCSAKWLISIAVAILLLFCVTANKICLLAIGHQYTLLTDTAPFTAVSPNHTSNATSNATSGQDQQQNIAGKEAIFLMLVLIIMIPQGVSLLYAFWGKRKSQLWPSKKAIKWIFIGGLVEVSCLVFLCVCVPTVLALPPDLFVLLVSVVFLVPTMWQAYKAKKKWSTRSGKLQMMIFVVSAALQLEGLVVLVNSDRITTMEAKIGIPISLVLLSLAWSPRIRKLQTQPRQQTGPRSAITDRQENQNSATLKIRKKAARAKAALLMSAVKIIFTPAMSLVFCKVFKVADIGSLGSGFSSITSMGSTFTFFMVQIFSTFAGYHIAWLACAMCIQKIGFALPLTFATPLAFFIVQMKGICNTVVVPLPCGPDNNLNYIVAVGLFIWIGQFISTGYYVWKSHGYIMGKANHLFWLPSYNGPLLEHNLLLNRRNRVTDDYHVSQKHLSRDTYVFICTTMYHEEDYEMEQLLNSLHDVDCASKKAGRHIESHVFFDGCISAEKMNTYILQLVSLIESSLKVKVQKCVKVVTPYGMQLRWQLPGGMPFTVHLKDNSKVKNKKRWSQVMYMSYVLDYKKKMLNVRDDQTFILTTDADVNFTHQSMEALIDYMLQDETIGAVCGRTHPMGKGPLVWYQIFDYAIGHWFMKVANHMFGSVLCCPGCFSLYRCQAVRSILPTYSTPVNEAFEFLTKDMGEDRWMCTLMVQQGWRLTYCAAAEDVTYCPMNFDEFYKQRRRWMPSTLANLALLISEWRVTLKNNEHISFPFILFQMFLLCSTVIGPSTVILVIVGGMVYSGLGVDPNTTTVIISLVTLAYGFICLFFSQDFQLKVAKFLTFVFAIIMILVTIGVAVQINKEIQLRQPQPTLAPNTTASPSATVSLLSDTERQLPAGISTLYLAGLAGLFLAAGALHPTEAYCLINGIFYLLCLPSGYLFLTIYSVANMTDRSWGTREGKVAKKDTGGSPLADMWNNVKSKLSCCCKLLHRNKKGKSQDGDKKNKDRKDGKGKRRRRDRGRTRSAPPNGSGSEYSDSSSIASDEDDIYAVDNITENRRALSVAGLINTGYAGSVMGESYVNSVYDMEIDLGAGGITYDPLTGITYDPLTGRPIRIGNRRNTPSEHSFQIQEGSHYDLPVNRNIDFDCPECQLVGNYCDRCRTRGNSLPERGRRGSVQETTPKRHSAGRTILSGAIHEDVVVDAISPLTRERIALQGGIPVNAANRRRASSVASSPGIMMNPGARRGSVPSYISAPLDNAPPGNDMNLNSLGESGYTSGNSHSLSRRNGFEAAEDERYIVMSRQTGGLTPVPPPSNPSISPSQHPSMPFMPSFSDFSQSMDDRTMSNLYLKDNDLNMPVEEWIGQTRLKVYIQNFKKHGYDNLKFISLMTEKDLHAIGIEVRGHRQRLVREVKRIPKMEIEEGIPDNVRTWLEDLSLGQYWPYFMENSYIEPSDLEDLKSMGKELVQETFKVNKTAHITMLWQAIRKLQYPNTGQVQIRQARRELDRCITYELETGNEDDGAEFDFWEGLRTLRLMPELAGFDGNTELKDKLADLRNSTLFIFLVTNILWMIVILVLVQQPQLKILGVDVVGLAFLCIYGSIMVFEFLAMIAHRISTLIHVLSRAPYVCGVKQKEVFRIEAEPEEVVILQ